VINVTDRPYVDVRFGSIKLFLAHGKSPDLPNLARWIARMISVERAL